jgi:predicted RNase H-like nuclease (RuvC/YqgF family)
MGKVYYLHTIDIFEATNKGESGLILKKDFDSQAAELTAEIELRKSAESCYKIACEDLDNFKSLHSKMTSENITSSQRIVELEDELAECKAEIEKLKTLLNDERKILKETQHAIDTDRIITKSLNQKLTRQLEKCKSQRNHFYGLFKGTFLDVGGEEKLDKELAQIAEGGE